MLIHRGERPFSSPPPSAVVTVGVFDGVHVAHQRVIRTAVRLARRLQGTSVVITFDPDPQQVLDRRAASPALMPIEARLEALSALGVDRIWVIPFTARFASMTAEQFVREMLLRRLRAVAVVVGEAFAFGRHRQGTMAMLQALGPPAGMRIVSVPHLRRGGAPVSSSRIRRLISRGHLSQARQLLGRAPALYGTVVRGAGRGRRLGVPTANVRLIPQVLPPRGVYAVHVRVRDGRRVRRGVMNFGVRPTFGAGPLVCEVHLLRFSGRLLGQSVTLFLLARLRSERRFPTPESLRRQIHRDLLHAKKIFLRARS
jgi:riboflavin kinase/FMN adenylyltransferase